MRADSMRMSVGNCTTILIHPKDDELENDLTFQLFGVFGILKKFNSVVMHALAISLMGSMLKKLISLTNII